MAPAVAMYNSEVTAKRADDSMSMVAMVLYNSLIPAGDPVAARTFLPCRTSWTTIMRVRRVLSETEIEKYRMLDKRSLIFSLSPGGGGGT